VRGKREESEPSYYHHRGRQVGRRRWSTALSVAVPRIIIISLTHWLQERTVFFATLHGSLAGADWWHSWSWSWTTPQRHRFSASFVLGLQLLMMIMTYLYCVTHCAHGFPRFPLQARFSSFVLFFQGDHDHESSWRTSYYPRGNPDHKTGRRHVEKNSHAPAATNISSRLQLAIAHDPVPVFVHVLWATATNEYVLTNNQQCSYWILDLPSLLLLIKLVRRLRGDSFQAQKRLIVMHVAVGWV